MEEDFILFKKLKEKPVRDCVGLSRNVIGKRNGFLYFTESFRIDFENKMYKLVKMQEELDKKDKVIDLMARAINNYDSQLVINRFSNKDDVKQCFIQIAEEENE